MPAHREPPQARPQILGIALDSQTRCAHYRTPVDIIAIKMKCCLTYYACKDCHETLAYHATDVWRRDEWDSLAVLCGACGLEMTVSEYLECSNRCPACDAHFNPLCSKHYHHYFEAP